MLIAAATIMAMPRSALVPDGLRAFIHKKIETACPVGTTLDVTALIDNLAAAAPPEADLGAWVHQQATQAFSAIEKNHTIAPALAAGKIQLLDAVAFNKEHRAAAEQMYITINGHHGELRRNAGAASEVPPHAPSGAADTAAATDDSPGSVHSAEESSIMDGPDVDQVIDSAWLTSISDSAALNAYAAAATQIGTRGWVQMGIGWMSEVSVDFFAAANANSGAYRLARKEATRLCYAERGCPLSQAEESAIMAGLLRERPLVAEEGEEPRARPVRILDVGACGTLFDGHAGVTARAIDLCPQAGNADVAQCDFLQLSIGAEGSSPVVEPSDEFPGGALRQLPAASYDAVALSLVLSYLPKPILRGAMIRKARRVLPLPDATTLPTEVEVDAALSDAALSDAALSTNSDGPAAASVRRHRGLLLVVDTFSVDRRKASRTSGQYLSQWIEAIEAEGFTFLRHKVLLRSHALAFVTRQLAPEEEEAVRARDPPELRMLREERGTPWQGPGNPEVLLPDAEEEAPAE